LTFFQIIMLEDGEKGAKARWKAANMTDKARQVKAELEAKGFEVD